MDNLAPVRYRRRIAALVVLVTVSMGACASTSSSSVEPTTVEDRYRARVGELQADDEILRDVGPLAPMSEVVALPGWVGAIDEGEVYCSFKRTHGSFEAAFGNRFAIGVALIVTGVLLAFSAKTARGRRGWRQFRWWQAILVGLA